MFYRMERLLGMPVRAADSRAAQMDVYELTTTVRGGSGHETPGALEPKLTIKTSVLFGTLLGPAVPVTAQASDAGRERLHIDTDKDGAVWPSASASGREPADRAGSVARSCPGGSL
jgi:hypothetical protein